MNIIQPTFYAEGFKARKSGTQIGANPYDQVSELVKYESWMDGWAQADFDIVMDKTVKTDSPVSKPKSPTKDFFG